ncbi:MAG: metal ABC transporter permease, partial [Rhodospirillaceae bacterium]|nr:metal ABC transporter permease [Rhodospirillaceae bacterium]
GLVVVSLMETVRVDLMGYLVGDILAVSDLDLIAVTASLVVGLGGLYLLWRPVLAIVVNEDLARLDGVAVGRTNAIMLMLTALVVAVAIKLVGILLVVALMIIPAGVARSLARTPEQMVLWSMAAGVLSVVSGIGASLLWDIQTGPSIVVTAAILLGVVWLPALRRS